MSHVSISSSMEYGRKIRLQHLNKIAPTWLAACVQGGELHLPESPLLHAGLLWIKKRTHIRFGRWKQNRDNLEDCGRQRQRWTDTEGLSGYQPVIVCVLLCSQLTFQTAGLDNQQWSSVPNQALGPRPTDGVIFTRGRNFPRVEVSIEEVEFIESEVAKFHSCLSWLPDDMVSDDFLLYPLISPARPSFAQLLPHVCKPSFLYKTPYCNTCLSSSHTLI